VGGAYYNFLDLSFMYVSNLEITSLTRSFTIATFSSTLAKISASCKAFVVYVSGCFAMASVSSLFCYYNVAICTPIAFTRFCKAFACDMAVGPVLAAFSSASRRVVYVYCVARAEDRPLT
jgi:hypothetical protein